MSDEPRDEQDVVDQDAGDVSESADAVEETPVDPNRDVDDPSVEPSRDADDPSVERSRDADDTDSEDEDSDPDSEDEDADSEDEEPEPEPEPTWVRTSLDDVTAAADAVLDAVESGGLVVLPTDTVYGIGADAYNKAAVSSLLAAKGRGRDMPPPVLVADAALVKALAKDIPRAAEDLMAAHWPGPLTVILTATTNLGMDLGDTHDTVGIRVPDHDGLREVLRNTGPLAVSSANKTGEAAATTADEAIDQLGNSVALYVDGGSLSDTADAAPSSMVDFSKSNDGVIVRVGALSVRQLRETVPELTTLRDEDDPDLPVEPPEEEEVDELEPLDSARGPEGETDDGETRDSADEVEGEPDGEDARDSAEESADDAGADDGFGPEDIAAQIHEAAGAAEDATDDEPLDSARGSEGESARGSEGESARGAEGESAGGTEDGSPPDADERPVH